jgi:hypothetical protein
MRAIAGERHIALALGGFDLLQRVGGVVPALRVVRIFLGVGAEIVGGLAGLDAVLFPEAIGIELQGRSMDARTAR